MKTPQIVERDFFGYTVRQNHLTRMFCANDLLKVANELSGTSKQLRAYMSNDSTTEYIEYMIQTERIPANEVVVTLRGAAGATWFHPYLMVDFAMWLKPEFKFKVSQWVFDQLCYLRDAAGDEFQELTATLHDVLEPERQWVYTNEIRLIQGLAGVDTGTRNSATEEQLSKLRQLQAADIKLLKQGMTSYSDRKKRLIQFAEML